MWLCPHCGEEVEENFGACWNCGEERECVVGMDEDDVSEESKVDNAESLIPTCDEGMTRREVANLICKTLALVLFALAGAIIISGIVMFLELTIAAPFLGFDGMESFLLLLVLIAPAAALLIIGSIFWKNSSSIASKMVSADPSPATPMSISVQDVLFVVLCTVGITTFVKGAHGFAFTLYNAVEFDLSASEIFSLAPTWSAIIQLAIGLILLLSAPVTARGICRLQTAGHAKIEPEVRVEKHIAEESGEETKD